jgi:tetratricopeptide (TPR) repeat protein
MVCSPAVKADGRITMAYRYLLFPIGFMAMLSITGCASSNAETGIRYLEQKNYTAAISEFDSAAAIKPHPQIYFGYFEAYMGLTDYENAIKYLTIGLLKYPNDAWLNLCAGHWYMQNRNDPRKALYYYEKAGRLRFGKSKNIMNRKINEYIGIAKDQIVIDSLENDIKEQSN